MKNFILTLLLIAATIGITLLAINCNFAKIVESFFKKTNLDVGTYNINKKVQQASELYKEVFILDLDFNGNKLKNGTSYKVSLLNVDKEPIVSSTAKFSNDWSEFNCDEKSLKEDAGNLVCDFSDDFRLILMYNATPMVVDGNIVKLLSANSTNLILSGSQFANLSEQIYYLQIAEL